MEPIKKYEPRLAKPMANNPYYNTKANGGYSTAIKGKPTDEECDVLANCVGYAFGRFNEIAGNKKMTYLAPRNAELFVSIAKEQGLEVGTEPRLGAIACWQKGNTLSGSDGAGHVAVVEQIFSPDKIVTSESGYNAAKPFWTQTRFRGTNQNWGQSIQYKFLGFIYNPAINVSKNPYPMPRFAVRRGDVGDEVRWMQWALCEAGYLQKLSADVDGDGTITPSDAQQVLKIAGDIMAGNDPDIARNIDGVFGKVTLGALVGFQLDNDIDPDGICGPETKSLLELY